jgi:predicted MFS family arabinose efflux permease
VELTLAPIRAALGHRTFATYLIVSAFADCGFWIAIVAQGWLVVRLAHSPFWLGAVGAAAQAPALFMSLLGGLLADRFDRRVTILVAEIGVAIIAIVTAVLAARDGLNLVGLIALAFASGTLLAIENPADRAYINDLIGGDDIEHAIALSSLEFSIARTAGPAIGGVAVATLGIAGGYALQAAFVAPIVIFMLYALRRHLGSRETAREKETQPSDTSLGECVRYLLRERTILSVGLLVAIFTIGISPYVALLADIAKNVLHQRETGYGVLQAVAGLGAFVGAAGLAVSGEPKRMRTVLVGAVFLGAIALAVFTTIRQPIVAGIVLFAMGAVDALVYALGNSLIQERTDEVHRGRVNAFFAVAFLGGIPVGSLALGSLAGAIGSEWTLFASSLVVATCAVIFWFVAPQDCAETT